MSELLKFDLRLLERNFRLGVISDHEYQAFLRDLPDLEGNHDEISIEDLLPKRLLTKMMGGEEQDERSPSAKSDK
jgi:hypothetical protein